MYFDSSWPSHKINVCVTGIIKVKSLLLSFVAAAVAVAVAVAVLYLSNVATFLVAAVAAIESLQRGNAVVTIVVAAMAVAVIAVVTLQCNVIVV